MGKITRQELHSDLQAELDAVYDYIQGSINEAIGEHMANHNNPHAVTKAQVGLGNVTNNLQATKSEFDSHVATRNPHGTIASDVGAVPTGRRINAGNGLTGGGTLSGDRTLSVDLGYLDGRYYNVGEKVANANTLDGYDHSQFHKVNANYLSMGNNDGLRYDDMNQPGEFYWRIDGRDYRAYGMHNIKYGSGNPSGGKNGDIYIQY